MNSRTYAQPFIDYIQPAGFRISFDNSGIIGIQLDWFLNAAPCGSTTDEWYQYQLDTNAWEALQQAPLLGITGAYVGPAVAFSDVEIATTNLPTCPNRAARTVYFCVDFNQNNSVDLDSIVCDTAQY
jgi:hypothetical protein